MIRSRIATVLVSLVVLAGACKKSGPAGGTGGEVKAGGAPVAAPAEAAAAAGSGEPRLSDKPEAGSLPFGGMRISHGIAVDGRGRLYLTDFNNNRIRVFDSAGASFGGWGTTGTGNYGLKDPAAVSVSGDDVYVCDSWNGRIQRFSLAGSYKGTAAPYYGPGGLAAAGGRVAVSDTGRNQVALLDGDLKNEVRIGKLGKDPGDFSGPTGLAIGPSGNIYVADGGNHRVQVLTDAGKPKASWPVPGWKTWCLSSVQVDTNETVYASDCSGDSVWAFNASGKLVKTLTASDDGTKFFGPMGLAIDRKNRILYVGHGGSPPILTVKLGQ